MAVAHFTFDFSARDKCRNRVDHDDINRVRTHQRIDNFERLFTGVWLRHNQIVNIYTKLFGISWVKRMLCINKSGRASSFLRFGDCVQSQRCFA